MFFITNNYVEFPLCHNKEFSKMSGKLIHLKKETFVSEMFFGLT